MIFAGEGGNFLKKVPSFPRTPILLQELLQKRNKLIFLLSCV